MSKIRPTQITPFALADVDSVMSIVGSRVMPETMDISDSGTVQITPMRMGRYLVAADAVGTITISLPVSILQQRMVPPVSLEFMVSLAASATGKTFTVTAGTGCNLAGIRVAGAAVTDCTSSSGRCTQIEVALLNKERYLMTFDPYLRLLRFELLQELPYTGEAYKPKIWTGTQREYEALTYIDPNTTYIITD